VSDINTAVVDSLKVLDPKRPIREADIGAGQEQPVASPALFKKCFSFQARSYTARGTGRLTSSDQFEF